jgi:hypothetical protein
MVNQGLLNLAIIRVRRDITNHCYDQYSDEVCDVLRIEIEFGLQPIEGVYFPILRMTK